MGTPGEAAAFFASRSASKLRILRHKKNTIEPIATSGSSDMKSVDNRNAVWFSSSRPAEQTLHATATRGAWITTHAHNAAAIQRARRR